MSVICVVCDNDYAEELERCPKCECPQQIDNGLQMIPLDGVSIGQDLYLALWSRAQRLNRSVSEVIRIAIEHYISSLVGKKKA